MRPLVVTLGLLLLYAAPIGAAETQAEKNERMNAAIAERIKAVLAQHPPLPRPDPRKEPRR